MFPTAGVPTYIEVDELLFIVNYCSYHAGKPKQNATLVLENAKLGALLSFLEVNQNITTLRNFLLPSIHNEDMKWEGNNVPALLYFGQVLE